MRVLYFLSLIGTSAGFAISNRNSYAAISLGSSRINKIWNRKKCVYDNAVILPFESRICTASSKALHMAIEALTVDSISEDHEREGERMAKSIANWLDFEWYPQLVHSEMGNCAKKSYIASRERGETDIMSIMMNVGNDLEKDWQLYDKDAFNNAWDVANYVSDYLTERAGIEGCSCNYQIHDVEGFD